MAQGAELDLVDITYFTEDRPVYWVNDNVPFEELNANILTVDDKAILARNTAQTTASNLENHVSAVSDYPQATQVVASGGRTLAFTSPDTITASSGDFTADGYFPEMLITVTNVTLNNNRTYIIDAVTATSITVRTDVNSIVNEGPFNDTATLDAIGAHDSATTATSGFLSATDKTKLDGIATGAQVGILSPSDALELTSRKDTFLHLHPLATPTANGFMSTTDKVKLDGIADGAQANRLSDAEALNLTDGSNADLLHTHFFALTGETFTESVHDALPTHANIPGTQGFTDFVVTESYQPGPEINSSGGTSIYVFSHTYPWPVQVLSGGLSSMYWTGGNARDAIRIDNFAVVGNDGIISYTAYDEPPGGGKHVFFSCWQGGYGI